jgi:hypothetical protein
MRELLWQRFAESPAGTNLGSRRPTLVQTTTNEPDSRDHEAAAGGAPREQSLSDWAGNFGQPSATTGAIKRCRRYGTQAGD